MCLDKLKIIDNPVGLETSKHQCESFFGCVTKENNATLHPIIYGREVSRCCQKLNCLEYLFFLISYGPFLTTGNIGKPHKRYLPARKQVSILAFE